MAVSAKMCHVNTFGSPVHYPDFANLYAFSLCPIDKKIFSRYNIKVGLVEKIYDVS